MTVACAFERASARSHTSDLLTQLAHVGVLAGSVLRRCERRGVGTLVKRTVVTSRCRARSRARASRALRKSFYSHLGQVRCFDADMMSAGVRASARRSGGQLARVASWKTCNRPASVVRLLWGGVERGGTAASTVMRVVGAAVGRPAAREGGGRGASVAEEGRGASGWRRGGGGHVAAGW